MYSYLKNELLLNPIDPFTNLQKRKKIHERFYVEGGRRVVSLIKMKAFIRQFVCRR